MRFPRSILPQYPYPGLRPFERSEWPIFRGRDRMTAEIIDRLGDHHLVAVHGASGCGKSSLIRAGVLATLEREHARVDVRWRTASMRPGANPMWALAEALHQALRPEVGRNEGAVREARSILGRSNDGIRELLAELEFPPDHNLLLLVDQFEELFRYRRLAEGEAAAAAETQSFVERLLYVFEERPEGIYVVSTMRSDYLGDCAQFAGLPEALNRSQYLVPRMAPEQIEEAIAKPPELYGGKVDRLLVERIIKDMRGDPDHLPLMQHALLLMWVRALRRLSDEGHRTGVAAEEIRLSLDDYTSREIVNMYRALSIHGDAILTKLRPDQRNVAEVMFRRLTDVDEGKREIRRPTRCGTVRQLAGVELPELQTVVDAFRQPESSFIYASREELTDDTSLDISHESLIRQWDTLKNWVAKEAESARIYRRLCESAAPHMKDQEGLWGESQIAAALEWKNGENPTALWARRYNGDFTRAMSFLEESRIKVERDRQAADEARRQEERKKVQDRIKNVAIVAVGATVVVLTSLLLVIFFQNQDLKTQRKQLEALTELTRVTEDVYGALAVTTGHHAALPGPPESDSEALRTLHIARLYELAATTARIDELADVRDFYLRWKAGVESRPDILREHLNSIRVASREADNLSRMFLQSAMWPIGGKGDEIRNAPAGFSQLEFPECVNEELQNKHVDPRHYKMMEGTYGHWQAVVAFYADQGRRLLLGTLNDVTCELKIRLELEGNAQVDDKIEILLEPESIYQNQFRVSRLRWFPICESDHDGACKETSLVVDRDTVMSLKGNVEDVKFTGDRRFRIGGSNDERGLYWDHAPTLIVDDKIIWKVRELFKPSRSPSDCGSHASGALVCEPDSLVYQPKAGRTIIISEPILEGQSISAADFVTLDDAETGDARTFVAYVVSQVAPGPGRYGHILNVVRLDSWLLKQGDTDDLLRQPIMQVAFAGPAISRIRFGSEDLDGLVLLESEATHSFFRVVWSLNRLRKMICEIYSNLPQRSKDLIDSPDDRLPLTPTFRETVYPSVRENGPCPKV